MLRDAITSIPHLCDTLEFARSKSVLYVNSVAHPTFLEIVGQRRDITVVKVANDTPDVQAMPLLREAVAYQITSARHDLDRRFHVDADLLSRMPRLLVVSSNGAGYDTVDVDACTSAGVLVVNQAGGNAEAVAEHVVGMMIALSKRMFEADRASRRVFDRERSRFMGRDLSGKTIGIIGN